MSVFLWVGLTVKDYHINIFYSEEDDGYIVDVPDLKHCSAFGTTPEEALQEGMKAKEAWLSTISIPDTIYTTILV